jgi:hypothetical protein
MSALEGLPTHDSTAFSYVQTSSTEDRVPCARPAADSREQKILSSAGVLVRKFYALACNYDLPRPFSSSKKRRADWPTAEKVKKR